MKTKILADFQICISVPLTLKRLVSTKMSYIFINKAGAESFNQIS